MLEAWKLESLEAAMTFYLLVSKLPGRPASKLPGLPASKPPGLIVIYFPIHLLLAPF